MMNMQTLFHDTLALAVAQFEEVKANWERNKKPSKEG